MTVTTDYDPILIFGEVLVDQFPDGQRVLGGAPFNVGWHLTALGAATQLVSAVGHDSDGERIRAAMSAWGMDLSHLQTNTASPTGVVSVTFENGQPRYDILEQRAFDAIEPPRIEASNNGLLYHGTLALRRAPSRYALAALKQQIEGPIFLDVNLRDPWWDSGFVLGLADEASWVKLNDDELDRLCAGNGDAETAAVRFLERHNLEGVIVTQGAQGAFALTRAGEQFTAAPHPAVAVVDTVGAGDAFAAVMLLGIQRGWPLTESLQRAQAFASLIVQNRGAIINDKGIYASVADEWPK